MADKASSPFWRLPGTRLGWWAVGLAAVHTAMSLVNSLVFMRTADSTAAWRQVVLPFYGILMMLCGLAGGVVGLVALIRHRERSWLVWLTILPLALVLFFLLGEFLVPH